MSLMAEDVAYELPEDGINRFLEARLVAGTSINFTPEELDIIYIALSQDAEFLRRKFETMLSEGESVDADKQQSYSDCVRGLGELLLKMVGAMGKDPTAVYEWYNGVSADIKKLKVR